MEKYRVKPGGKIRLEDFNPDDHSEYPQGKQATEPLMLELTKKLDSLQELLYAEHRHKVLVVLQALDAGGKDGTIRSVLRGVNPQGVHIANFKVPTDQERDHDFLWRIHAQVPGRGELVVFNRSHYEDVLVVRVHKLVSKEIWRERYKHINSFEKILAEEGTTIVKFYLNMSKETQKQRLQERLDNPEKRWKFNPGDLQEREMWDEYINAYEDAINETSTDWAPWYVIPANHNWYRNLIVASVLVKTLENLKMKYPVPAVGLESIVIK